VEHASCTIGAISLMFHGAVAIRCAIVPAPRTPNECSTGASRISNLGAPSFAACPAIDDAVGRRRFPPYPLAMSDTAPIQVNRAPVLTLWATVVAERLGYPTDTALTLGRAVAGSSARAKARRLGIADEAQEAAERREWASAIMPRRQAVRLLGRDIPIMPANDGAMRANDDGKPASARSVQICITRAFGDRLGEVREAMEALAASLPPDELNRVGFRLYERFRPDVATRAEGWGAKGEFRIEWIQSARVS
jgi:hypothetical protein